VLSTGGVCPTLLVGSSNPTGIGRIRTSGLKDSFDSTQSKLTGLAQLFWIGAVDLVRSDLQQVESLQQPCSQPELAALEYVTAAPQVNGSMRAWPRKVKLSSRKAMVMKRVTETGNLRLLYVTPYGCASLDSLPIGRSFVDI
jgi:hypothetical protein